MKLLILHVCETIFICLLCFPCKSCCQDGEFEVCKRDKYCGNQTIRFPFYTQDIPQYCGFPGYELTCINNVLLLNLSGDQYRITQVFYANNSFHLSNVLSSRSGFCSLSSIHNFSLPSDHRYELHGTSNLILLSNCPSEFGEVFPKNKVGCDLGRNGSDWVLAIKAKDSNSNYTYEACNVAVAPVHTYDEADDSTDYLKLIRNGFDLKWTVTGCRECEDSGGYCGYEGEPVNEFKCLCDDVPQSGSCKPKGLNLVFFLAFCDFIYHFLCLLNSRHRVSFPVNGFNTFTSVHLYHSPYTSLFYSKISMRQYLWRVAT